MKEHFLYDLHTHTSFSDGRNDMPTMLHAAESYGIRGMVFSDHTFSDEEAETLLRNYRQLFIPLNPGGRVRAFLKSARCSAATRNSFRRRGMSSTARKPPWQTGRANRRCPAGCSANSIWF